MFSEFQEKKTKLSELYLANGWSESKSSSAQRIVGFFNSLTNLLNPDANFVPQERVKALKVLQTLCFLYMNFHRQICLCSAVRVLYNLFLDFYFPVLKQRSSWS